MHATTCWARPNIIAVSTAAAFLACNFNCIPPSAPGSQAARLVLAP
jgi:hypothetical protein